MVGRYSREFFIQAVHLFRRAGALWRGARYYGKLAYQPVMDWPRLAVLGACVEYDFTRSGRFTRLAKKMLPRVVVRPRALGGMRVVLSTQDTSHVDIFNEVVREGVYDLGRIGFEPALIVDCGGHIGLFVVLASQRFPKAKTVVFEPLPQNLAYLHTAARLNNLHIDMRRQAVSDKAGTVFFYERNSCGGSMAAENAPFHRKRKVKMVDLVALLKEWRPASLLLKMDIEGEELTLLPKLCSLFPRDCAIFFETHHAAEGWQTVSDALHNAGFRVELIRERDPYRDGVALR